MEEGLVEDLALGIGMTKCFLFGFSGLRKIGGCLPVLSALPFADLLYLLGENCIDTFQFFFKFIRFFLLFGQFRVGLAEFPRNLLELGVFMGQLVLEEAMGVDEVGQLGVETGQEGGAG